MNAPGELTDSSIQSFFRSVTSKAQDLGLAVDAALGVELDVRESRVVEDVPQRHDAHRVP
jgi:hypothetical protein